MNICVVLAMLLSGFQTGNCNGCDPGLFYENNECKLCPTNCTLCSSISQCTVCKIGNHGESCSLSCSENCHDKECNQTTGVCLSCKKGYFMDAKGFCLKCPVNCTTCNSNTFCFACKNGYKGESCQDSCSDCEIDSRCDKNTGYCLDRCRRGFSGELCNINCDLKCTSCDRLKQYECNSCSHDRYGLNCNEVCPPTCFNKSCNDADALCTEGCVPGHWGKMCNKTCSADCKDMICNIKNGECLKGTHETITTTSLAAKWGVALCVILIAASLCSALIIFYLRRKQVTLRTECWQDNDASNVLVQYKYIFGLCRIDIEEDFGTPASTSDSPEISYSRITEKCRDTEEQTAAQSVTDETRNTNDGHSKSEDSESDLDTSHFYDALSELSTSPA